MIPAMAMVRKQVYIHPEQEVALKRRAKVLGVSEAELIRRGLDLASQGSAQPPFDALAWQEERTFMAERAKQFGAGTHEARQWRRDDVYEERLANLVG